MSACRVQQAPEDRGRIGLGLHPLAQAPPLANQAFVRDIDDRIGRKGHVLTWSQKSSVPMAEVFHDLLDSAPLATDNVAELIERERTPHRLALRPTLC